MNRQMMEEAGTTKSRSSGNSGFRKHLFMWMLCHPVFLVFYFLFCRTAYKLCMYGGVRRRGSILLGCALFFLIYLIQYVYRCCHIHVEKEQEPDLEKVWFYGFYKKGVYLFDKKHGYYEKNFSKEESDFNKLKYKKLPRYRYHFWKVPACIFILVITVVTVCGIYNSSQNYNGKLAWALAEVGTTKYILLRHDNLYESGIQGIFEDIEEKVQLPENLTLNGVFNLHFSQDGDIVKFDMMLKGYNDTYEFVDTYLISYPSSRGNRIRVQKGNYAEGQEYDAEKAIDALIIGGIVLPYQEAISEWNEEEYGIYYLGSRTWNKWDENIFSLSVDGSVEPMDWKSGNEVTGYSISVFCPDNSQVTPKRYMIGYETNEGQEDAIISEITDSETESQITETEPEIIIDEKIYLQDDYGYLNTVEEHFENASGEESYYYTVDYFYFTDEKYSLVNATLQQIYQEREQEYKAYSEWYVDDYMIDENIPFEGQQINYKKWYMVGLRYVGDDYVSILFNDIAYFAGAAHPQTCFTPVTISVDTGKVVTAEEVLGMSWNEIKENEAIWKLPYENEKDFNEEFGFYLTEKTLTYILRYRLSSDLIVIER